MLILADGADVVLNLFAVAFTLVVFGFGIWGLIVFIAGFVQMNNGRSWDGFNLIGLGAFIMLMSFMYLRLTFFDTAGGDLDHFHQRSLAAMLFAMLYGAFIGFFRLIGVPWGILFVIGVIFVADKI